MSVVAKRSLTEGVESVEAAGSSRLGTACFRSPDEVAAYHRFEPGDFWIGRCPFTGAPLGHADDRHVLLVSGTREGKGTGIIVPNLCLWPGSAVVIDPKGENATITAARRGSGSEYADGMGQDVYVLDPMRRARIDEKYRMRFNALDALDANAPDFTTKLKALDVNAPDFTTKLKALAVALMPLSKNESDGGIWIKVGRRLLMHLIMHVLTCEDFEGRRNLVTVRRLLTLGDYELYRTLELAGKEDLPTPFALLWESMRMNPALDGAVCAAGQQYIDNAKNNPKRNEDIRLNAIEETDFLDAEQFKELMSCSDFSLDELRTNPKGVTIYLCLPFEEIGSYYPWLRLMVTLCLSAVQKDESLPACGHRTLFCLDEFASLQHMAPVQEAMAQVASYHVTMFLVLQGIEQLEELYGKGWDVFLTNCGLQIHFGVGHRTAEHLSRAMGETEVIRSAATRSTSEAQGTTTTETTSRAETEGSTKTKSTSLTQAETATINRTLTHTKNRSDTVSLTETAQEGRSHAKTQSAGRGGGTSTQWGENWNKTAGTFRGKSEGEQTSWNKGRSGGSGKSESWARPGHGILGDVAKYIPWVREQETVSYQTQQGWNEGRGSGTNRGVNSGSNASASTGGSRGGGSNTSWNENEGNTDTVSASRSEAKGRSSTGGTSDAESVGEGSSRSESRTVGTSEARQQSTTLTTGSSRAKTVTRTTTKGVNESVHKRPLMTPDEIAIYFGREDARSRPGEPAWALILLKGHRPAVVHRSPYFRDVGFRWLFDPDPRHAAGSKLVGTIAAHVPPLHAPQLQLLEPKVKWLVKKGGRIERGARLLTVELAGPESVLGPAFLNRHQEQIGVVMEALCGASASSAARAQIPVFAGASGTLAKREVLSSEGGEDEAFVEIVGNRRRHHEAEQEELPRPMAEYLKYLSDLYAQKRDEERDAEQAEKEARAQRARDEEQRRKHAEKEERERAATAAKRRYAQLREQVFWDACDDWWASYKKRERWLDLMLLASLLAMAVTPWFGLFEVRGGSGSLVRVVWMIPTILFTGGALLLVLCVCAIPRELYDHLRLRFSESERKRWWRDKLSYHQRGEYIDARIARLEGGV